MTPFWRGLKTSGRIQKHGKIEKVFGSQDDAFLEGIEKHLVGSTKHGKIEKVTGSQDDGFLEGVLTKNKQRSGVRKEAIWTSR